MLTDPWLRFCREQLNNRRALGRYRRLQVIESAQDTQVVLEGKAYIAFCSNNYLGLANHPALKEAAAQAINKYGWGAGASRLISGNMSLHQVLEQGISRLKNTESALVYSTGYMANIGAITALASKGDAVIIDRADHASIIDACRQSGARLLVYEHNNIDDLRKILRQADRRYKKLLIVTDSVFSMDGDIAPLPELVELSEEFGALLMIDEAHATGVLGERGRGALEHFGLKGQVGVVMGTLSKALGGIGGFIAGSELLIDYLRNCSRSFIYTTAPPPAVCAASLAALKLIEEEGWRRKRLVDNVAYVKGRLSGSGFDCDSSPVPIIPIVIGREAETTALSRRLFEQGILVPPIRPPTVPKDKCLLRLTLMATHSGEQLDKLIDALRRG